MAGLGHWYVEIRKQAFWRGNPHEWVNRYVMSGADPSPSDAATVVNALKGIENEVYPHVAPDQGVGFVDGRAYGAAGGPPFVTEEYNAGAEPGTATGFTGPSAEYEGISFGATLESCLDVRTPLQGLSSTGKPMYLRKFFRGIYVPSHQDDSAVNVIPAADITTINTNVASWHTGIGSGSWQVISEAGRLSSSSPVAQPWIGNHQVPKGRKRKLEVGIVGGVARGVIVPKA